SACLDGKATVIAVKPWIESREVPFPNSGRRLTRHAPEYQAHRFVRREESVLVVKPGTSLYAGGDDGHFRRRLACSHRLQPGKEGDVGAAREIHAAERSEVGTRVVLSTVSGMLCVRNEAQLEYRPYVFGRGAVKYEFGFLVQQGVQSVNKSHRGG